MSEIQTSHLRLRTDKKGGKRLVVTYRSKKGKELEWSAPPPSLSVELATQTPEALDNCEVDFELIDGHPDRIRPKGGVWQAPAPTPPARSAGRGSAGRSGPERGRHWDRRGDPGGRGRGRSQSPRTLDFHNPYNFIPTPPRGHLDETQNPFRDHRPVGHHAYLPGYWSGQLTVRLRTATPLLLPDASRVTTDSESRHKTFPLRRGPDGASPYLPPTSVKGMLRAAYEAVTNSRLGVFEAHKRRLGLRMEARDGLSLVPASVTRQGDRLRVQLMPGDAVIGDDGRPEEALMYAAWLPRYRKCWPDTEIGTGPRKVGTDKGEGDPKVSKRYPDGGLPQHGDEVWVRLEREEHRSRRFSFQRVREIVPAQEGRNPPSGWRRGIVCITGRNIMNKHDERVFLEGPNDPPPIALSLESALAKQWEELIADYREIHEKDLQERMRKGDACDAYLGHEPGNTGWSRHVFDPVHTRLDSDRPLLCYARVSRASAGFLLHRIYPVMISRDLFDSSPGSLVDSSLTPAESIGDLSPAERVFGWVRPERKEAEQDNPTAWKGQLRVGPVRCSEGATAIESFAQPADGALPGVPLAILGQPKPQQSRFYAARDKNGNPMADGSRKKDGYLSGQSLRGRKVYPHHRHLADLPDYWSNPMEDRTRTGVKTGEKPNTPTYHQEYRRPEATDKRGKDSTCDDQNRSILEWVKPDVVFEFDIQVTNLSGAELGALLWLLTLDDDLFLRLGGGKPLGFGSVRLELEGTDLRDGDGWLSYYRHLLPPNEGDQDNGSGRIVGVSDQAAEECIRAFQQALIDAYPAPSFAEIPFIKAFETSCRGFADGLPIHYPRVDTAPNPEGKSFLWFTENDSRYGLRLALAGLHLNDPGLPLRPKSE